MTETGPVDGLALRRALSRFATGVTVITAVDPATAEPRGMTANAFMSGSLVPPLILVSVKLSAHLHTALSDNSWFGVSVLPESLEREARRFAGLPLEPQEPPPRLEWQGDVPVLERAIAWFTATIVNRHPTGDHTLFVGEVRDFAAPHPDAVPLIFHGSQFAHLDTRHEYRPLPSDPWGWALDLWG
ncbi:MAG TPA: flavin reductase family protein [Solirubrobacteraceae bacterium]|nr:flavin reductase family protein [Solirubrobacteraceae bacterium]